MAKRMDEDEQYYRVPVEVEYDITHCHYHRDWDHTLPTSEDNPLYVYDTEPTHYHYHQYLGPYSSIQMAERERDKFDKSFRESESHKNLKITWGDIETAWWVKI